MPRHFPLAFEITLTQPPFGVDGEDLTAASPVLTLTMRLDSSTTSKSAPTTLVNCASSWLSQRGSLKPQKSHGRPLSAKNMPYVFIACNIVCTLGENELISKSLLSRNRIPNWGY